MSTYYKHASPQTLLNLLKMMDMKPVPITIGMIKFYPQKRKEIHPMFGSQKYLDVDDLFDRLISGWQSDLTMMEGVIKRFKHAP